MKTTTKKCECGKAATGVLGVCGECFEASLKTLKANRERGLDCFGNKKGDAPFWG